MPFDCNIVYSTGGATSRRGGAHTGYNVKPSRGGLRSTDTKSSKVDKINSGQDFGLRQRHDKDANDMDMETSSGGSDDNWDGSDTEGGDDMGGGGMGWNDMGGDMGGGDMGGGGMGWDDMGEGDMGGGDMGWDDMGGGDMGWDDRKGNGMKGDGRRGRYEYGQHSSGGIGKSN